MTKDWRTIACTGAAVATGFWNQNQLPLLRDAGPSLARAECKMVDKYLFLELMFLVPLILVVAFSMHRRNDKADIRFFWIATAVSVSLMALNVVLMPSQVGFPATVAFLLLISAYAIHPALVGSFFSTLMGVMAVVAADRAADTYCNSHVGSFADRNHSLFTSFTALTAGIATVVLVQISIKYVARLR